MGLIPFSDPPTEEELKVTWENVIEIRTSDLYEVSQSQWNTLISNIGKFPRLCNLVVRNCRFTTITADDLEKLSKLHKVSFIERTFSEETRRLLDEFKENHHWIQVTHNRIWLMFVCLIDSSIVIGKLVILNFTHFNLIIPFIE